MEKNFKTTVQEKMALLEALENIMEVLDREQNYITHAWRDTGETKQATDWHDNLLWLDENGEKTTENTGTPKMIPVTEEYNRDFSELEDYEQRKYTAYETIRKALEKLA